MFKKLIIIVLVGVLFCSCSKSASKPISNPENKVASVVANPYTLETIDASKAIKIPDLYKMIQEGTFEEGDTITFVCTIQKTPYQKERLSLKRIYDHAFQRSSTDLSFREFSPSLEITIDSQGVTVLDIFLPEIYPSTAIDSFLKIAALESEDEVIVKGTCSKLSIDKDNKCFDVTITDAAVQKTNK